MSLVQKAEMHSALAVLRAITQNSETHAAVRLLAEADVTLVVEELAPTIVNKANSLGAERILERGIKRYIGGYIATLQKDGVREHEIGAYGLAYIVAVMNG